MQTRNKGFGDAARVAGGALGALSGLRREMEGMIRHQLDRLLSGMDLVNRDEFEAVREMAAKARIEQERLETRIAELEAQLGQTPGRTTPAARTGAKRGPGTTGPASGS